MPTNNSNTTVRLEQDKTEVNNMKDFNLDKWLIERYAPLTLERIKKAHFGYDDVVDILNASTLTECCGAYCSEAGCCPFPKKD